MAKNQQRAPGSFGTKHTGRPYSLEHRIFIEKDGKVVSPFHDIPLYADDQRQVLNMVVEIPRFTNAKFEISRDLPLNPIKQDVKDGKVRFVNNSFPYKGYIWNYGALPQTWEDPHVVHPAIGHPGDNDPLDACEIGTAVSYRGEVKQVKVLGIMCLIDGEETDWKVMVVDVRDAAASRLNDLKDIETVFPGLMAATLDWFRIYKKPDGKPTNRLGLNGEFRDKKYAEGIIEECSHAWTRLISGEADRGTISLQRASSSTAGDSADSAARGLDEKPSDTSDVPEPDVDGWYFFDRQKL